MIPWMNPADAVGVIEAGGIGRTYIATVTFGSVSPVSWLLYRDSICSSLRPPSSLGMEPAHENKQYKQAHGQALVFYNICRVYAPGTFSLRCSRVCGTAAGRSTRRRLIALFALGFLSLPSKACLLSWSSRATSGLSLSPIFCFGLCQHFFSIRTTSWQNKRNSTKQPRPCTKRVSSVARALRKFAVCSAAT